MPKLKELKTTHGKTENFRPTTLNQIWGDDGTSLYHTMDETEYSKHIATLSKGDLQSHAASVGVLPMDDKENLTKKLIRGFREHVSAYRIPREGNKAPKKVSEKVRAILSEGR